MPFYKLGEKAAASYMKNKGGTKLFPKGEVGVDAPRSGEFDQVWKVGEDIYIVEAKGGASTRGFRKVDGQQVQQGTEKYMNSIIDKMEKSNGDLIDEITIAQKSRNLKYIEVRQKITSAGKLGNISIKEFNL